MASADWMPRNLDRRVEIMFPLLDEGLKKKAVHILEVQLAANVGAYILQPDGSYSKAEQRDSDRLCAQEKFCEEAVAAAGDKSAVIL